MTENIFEYLKKTLIKFQIPPTIKMNEKDWDLLVEQASPKKVYPFQLEITTSRSLIESGERGYLFGSPIIVEDRIGIAVDPW